MTKQLERQPRIKISPDALPKQKGPHGEKMTVFQRKGAVPQLDVITLKQSLQLDRTVYGYPSKNNNCPVESNVSCPDASCPSSSCGVPNTDNRAHTCAPSCSYCR